MLLATDVSGSQSGTWSVANSPYNVVADISIPAGQVLTIEPGVLINVNGLFQITAQGHIIAEGTETDSIRFNSTGRWKGIRLESLDQTSIFKHCRIDKVENGINPINSPVSIIKCHVNDATENCVRIYGIGGMAQTLIKQTKISGSLKSGINITQNSNVVVDSCDIYNNGLGTQFYGGIHLQNQSVNGECNPLITNNRIHHNLKQGINAWDVTSGSRINPTVRYNLIENNLTGLNLRQTSGLFEYNIVRNNFITGNANSGAGFMIAGASSSPVIRHNQVTGNYTAFYIGEGATPNLGSVEGPVENIGMNTIQNNIDGSGVSHSIYIYSGAGNVLAQNNIWDSTDPSEIDITINDQLDNPALGLVTYLPVYMPTNLSGTISYEGSLSFSHLYLVLIDYLSFDNIQILPLSGVGPYSVNVPAGNYFIQAIGLNSPDMEDDPVVFGVYNDMMIPAIVQIQTGQLTDNIDILLADYSENMIMKILDSFTHENNTIFAMGIFNNCNLEEIVLFKEEGNYIYMTGNREFNPESGQWENNFTESIPVIKNHDAQLGDFWGDGYLGVNFGPVSVPVTVNNQTLYPNRFAYYNDDYLPQNLLSKQYFSDGIGIVLYREYDNDDHCLSYERRLISYDVSNGGSGLFPLAIGNEWILEPTEMPDYPSFLSVIPDTSGSFYLYWDAPEANEWVGYRVYRDNQLFAQSGNMDCSMTYFTLDDDYTNHSWYVTAYGNNGESDPSNVIQATDSEPPLVTINKTSITHYPNPINYNRKSLVSFNINLPEESDIDLNIYNVKGQKVAHVSRGHFSKGQHKVNWNALNHQNKQLANGVYFYQLRTKKETITRKILILKQN